MSSGRTPPLRRSSSESWEWVVEAGWMTSDFASPTFARSEKISPLMKISRCLRPLLMLDVPLQPETRGPKTFRES